MANKADRLYFENFVKAGDIACRASGYLVKCLENFEPQNIESMLADMHEFEHEGDSLQHEMSAALAKAFVTPVDREDLAMISQNMDDVTDKLEEVLQRFYVDQIQTVIPDAVTFARKLVGCCELLREIMREFVNFKKPTKLHELIIQLNQMEEECDKFYLDATLNIRNYCSDVLDIISWREILDHMENCSDACEHVGNCVDMVVLKNT